MVFPLIHGMVFPPICGIGLPPYSWDGVPPYSWDGIHGMGFPPIHGMGFPPIHGILAGTVGGGYDALYSCLQNVNFGLSSPLIMDVSSFEEMIYLLASYLTLALTIKIGMNIHWGPSTSFTRGIPSAN